MITFSGKEIRKADVVRVRRPRSVDTADLGSLFVAVIEPMYGFGAPQRAVLVFGVDPDGIEDVRGPLPPVEEYPDILHMQRAGWILENSNAT